jgi:hypothetical protein
MGSHFRARRGLRALVAATIVSTALLGATAGTTTAGAAAAAPTNVQRAQRGAQWLANQIKNNGGFLKNSGVADPVDTAYAVIGMRSVGVDKHASNLAMVYLKRNFGAKIQLSGSDSAGALAEFVMASVANAQDPRHFGGTAAANDLVARLLATQRTTGTDTGLFGAQAPTYDGAFRQGLALTALALTHVSPADPRVKDGIAWLKSQQCANGLWQAYRANTKVPCAAANAKTFSGPDTNSTALAVQGLSAWGSRPLQAKLLSTLRSVQSSDGGFPYIAAKGQASDPNSTALTIQALIAESSSPATTKWKKGTHTPFTALASYQIGCSSSGYGAFFFPGSPDASVFATVQSVPAMAGKKLPIGTSTKSVTIPLKAC